MANPNMLPFIVALGAGLAGRKRQQQAADQQQQAEILKGKVAQTTKILDSIGDDPETFQQIISTLEPEVLKYINVPAYAATSGYTTAREKSMQEAADVERKTKMMGNLFMQQILGQFGGLGAGGIGGESAPQEIPGMAATTAPEAASGGAPGSVVPSPTTAQQPGLPMTPSFANRLMIKKLFGLDIGSDPVDSGKWFQTFKQKTDAGVPVSQAMIDTSAQFGFIPEGAASLDSLSTQERDILFNKEFSKHMNDPNLDTKVSELYPNLPLSQAKPLYILYHMGQRDGYVPAQMQGVFDAMQGTNQVEIPDNELNILKRWGYDGPTAPPEIRELARKEAALQQAEQQGLVAEQTALGRERAERKIYSGGAGGGGEADNSGTAGQSFGEPMAGPGPVQRKQAEIAGQKEAEFGKMQIPAETAARLGKSTEFFDLENRVKELMRSITTENGKLNRGNIDLLPVGPMEIVRKRMDKYGINADKARIELRTIINQLVEIMYQIRGKQLSDREVALAQQVQASMDEMPMQFVTKLQAFLKHTSGQIRGEIDGLKRGGYNTSQFEDLMKEKK